jgi:acyl-CoA synthetase (AMP-forming)/AMP-acid ligase II
MFWEIERVAGNKTAIYESAEHRWVSYSEMVERVSALEEILKEDRKLLVMLLCDNSLASLTAYLAALRAGHAVVLVNAATDVSLEQRLLDIYAPEVILATAAMTDPPVGYRLATSPVPGLTVGLAEKPSNAPIDPATAVMLSTSGTTGSPKLIRLSYRNLQANAESIVQYLGIDATETAITSLPMSYSYGLSVINTHLLAGANIVCTNASVVVQEFWDLFTGMRCTTFASVPFGYGMLERLRFSRMDLPSLRTMTQAGGRLAPDKIRLFADAARQKGARFYVMYGQTEATARISYVPWERLVEKVGSVGVAIPGGTLHLEWEGREIIKPESEGEMVYEGPNVMLGYAETRDCLAKGDELRGRLATGDLGYRDTDGFFYITGRLKRFIKVFGLRLNLEEVEKMLESALSRQVACVGKDESLHVVIESGDEADVSEARRRVVELYKLHHSVVHVHRTTDLAVNSSGKKDYTAIWRGLK